MAFSPRSLTSIALLPVTWLRAVSASPQPDLVADSVRDDVAAVIYERVFPHLSWGNATQSGRLAAYAGADAVLEVLRPHLGAGPQAGSARRG